MLKLHLCLPNSFFLCNSNIERLSMIWIVGVRKTDQQMLFLCNLEKVGYLWGLCGAKERLKLVKADLMEEGSFDEAVDGVEGESLLDPCIKGTVNVLKSCSRSKCSIKRVVPTSSCSAIRYRADAQQESPLSESHWSDVEYCKRHNLWYAYAKTVAEQEAWRVAGEEGIDLVVVNPSFVVGPLISSHPTITLLLVLAILKGANNEEYPNTTVGFVHADDVVACHLKAMEEKRASGRLICSSSVFHWSEVVSMLKARCGEQVGDSNPHRMDTKKAQELGLTAFKIVDQMFDDCIKSFQIDGLI
ncbi:Tetraketide alpha-pyrone reductase 2 [Nymphaea thermarum]|nr:Tetraketide alpha-pyrone reductase 2 [Nymphaea thermarum]